MRFDGKAALVMGGAQGTGQGLILDGGLTPGTALALPENGAQTDRRKE
jgi:hypothetical protein